MPADPPPIASLFHGVALVPAPHLEGVGRGILSADGRTLHASPAFCDLCATATPAELDALVRSLKVVRLTPPPGPFCRLPIGGFGHA